MKIAILIGRILETVGSIELLILEKNVTQHLFFSILSAGMGVFEGNT